MVFLDVHNGNFEFAGRRKVDISQLGVRVVVLAEAVHTGDIPVSMECLF